MTEKVQNLTEQKSEGSITPPPGEVTAMPNSVVLSQTQSVEPTRLNDGVPESEFQLPEAELFIQSQFEVRYNLVSSRIEWKKRVGAEDFKPITDQTVNSMHRLAVFLKLNIPKSEIQDVLNSDFAVSYDPIVEYIDGLEKWEEGGVDWIKCLAGTVKTGNSEYWEKCLRKWLVAMVGSLLCSEVVNHTVLIFQGAQGAGKTTWLLNLVPKELGGYVYSGIVRPGNKDAELQLTETVLINIDDFEFLFKKDSGALKEMISKKVIRQRRAYGHFSENYVRRASFVASTNSTEFLGDITGSRRFLCFSTLEIDYQHKIPIDKVWAQAVHLFHAGFQYWFDEEEIMELHINNEQFTMHSAEEELLDVFFTPGSIEDHSHIMNATEMLSFISIRPTNYMFEFCSSVL